MARRSKGDSRVVENPFVAGSVAEQLYDLLARTETPLTEAEFARRLARDRGTVAETLESFVELGIVTERAESPPTYVRNDAQFPGDAAATLARERSLEDLESRMDELVDRVWRYQRRYDAETPLEVDVTSANVTEADLADWEAARAELRCHERARRIRLHDVVSNPTERS
ncbi:DUF7342 family protein [Natronococcus occultus]|uniref:Sugar-specific transcriptional regulator TrmB n=1 Tax=Natronococcus occultus SP4 TaxID=694430 RepID=L0K1Q7_9EURY|nr:Sugar-specific transcriptional regulator TrmB [Natronococcus occultus]AGB38921.1 Sugar-specific transcriptional regulator TrmB [Natronococcus occultus SP4]